MTGIPDGSSPPLPRPYDADMRNNIHTEALSKVTHETRAKLMVSDVMAQ